MRSFANVSADAKSARRREQEPETERDNEVEIERRRGREREERSTRVTGVQTADLPLSCIARLVISKLDNVTDEFVEEGGLALLQMYNEPGNLSGVSAKAIDRVHDVAYLSCCGMAHGCDLIFEELQHNGNDMHAHSLVIKQTGNLSKLPARASAHDVTDSLAWIAQCVSAREREIASYRERESGRARGGHTSR